MTTDDRTYWEQVLRKSPEGSSRRICAAAQLAKLDGKTKPAPAPTKGPKA